MLSLSTDRGDRVYVSTFEARKVSWWELHCVSGCSAEPYRPFHLGCLFVVRLL